jgi:hypothetical protein
MLETVIGILAAFLCVIGAAAIIRWCAIKISAPTSCGNRLYAVMLKGDCAEIELHMALETLDWDSALGNVRAYAIDCGLSESVRDNCKNICKNTRIRLITPKELEQLILTYK